MIWFSYDTFQKTKSPVDNYFSHGGEQPEQFISRTTNCRLYSNISQNAKVRCVEHELEYITFYVQKHIAYLAASSGPPAGSRRAARGARMSEARFLILNQLYLFFNILYIW